MSSLATRMQMYSNKISASVGQNFFMNVLRDSFIRVIPITLVGSIALVLMYFPYIEKVVPESFMTSVRTFLDPIVGVTFGLLAVYVTMSVGYQYAQQKKTCTFYYPLVAILMFFIQLPFNKEVNGETVGGIIPLDYLGAKGMFVGLLFGFLASWLMEKYEKVLPSIKLPDSVPPNVIKSFMVIVPISAVLFTGLVIRACFSALGYDSVHSFIYESLQTPLVYLGTSAPAFYFAEFMMQVLWFFGLHGDATVMSVLGPVWDTASVANYEAFAAGKELPYTFNSIFHESFVINGFVGCIVACLIVAKSQRARAVSKAAAVPAVFNISEPLVFGLPIVANFKLLIPWLLCRLINITVFASFITIGLVSAPTGVRVPWTTPQILSGFITTGSIMGAVVQIVALVINVIVWIPFIKNLDNDYLAEESKTENN
ncbi:TPA: PTS sugar transporter subunit IIC [Vibrio parahaemolyticus]